MKYLEELNSGDLFLWNNDKFILTTDFKKSKEDKSKKMAINIHNGFIQWIIEDAIVEDLDLYYRDKDANIVALKERKNEYTEKNSHFS
jgi:hypothetical protein